MSSKITTKKKVLLSIFQIKQTVLQIAYEMHDVASPPALEESPGDGGASKRPSDLWVLSVGGKYRAAGNAENGHGICPVVLCFSVFSSLWTFSQPHLSFMQKKGAVDGTKENQQGVFRIPPCTPTTATL